jgi:hypothetical protein
MKFGTKAIHAGIEPDPSTGAIMTPVYQTSTYVQASPGKHKGYEYARTQNPTRTALEKNLAALENGKYARCFASGMAATDAVAKLLKPGDEVISINDLYGGTYRIFTKVFAQYGIKFHFVPMDNPAEVSKYVNERTKMLWVETPTNPMMSIVDIKALAGVARQNNAWLVVDNTFASPYLQNPLDLGADIVLHSITKYLGGHSDTVMGATITNDAAIEERLAFLQNACGAVPGPQDCFLVLRGIKTLFARVTEKGLLLSESPPGERGLPGAVPRRNRLISGLATALVVVEAAEDSGTLITVTCALEQGRDVYAVPGPINSKTSRGTNRLIRDGAVPILEPGDLTRALGLGGTESRKANVPFPLHLSDNEARVLASLRPDPSHVDELALSSGMSIGLLLGTLLGLEIGGLAEQLPGAMFRRRS